MTQGKPEPPIWTLHNARRLLAILLQVFSLAVFLTGVGFAVYAGVQWLQTARWQPMTVNGLLARWPTTREWVAHPREWLGLHRVIAWTLGVPVFVIVTALGGLLLILSPPLTPPPPTEDRFWSVR